MGYFPSLDATGMEENKPAFTEAKRVLYHECMRMIIKDLEDATLRFVLVVPDVRVLSRSSNRIFSHYLCRERSGRARTDRLVIAIRLLPHSKWTIQNPRC